MAVSHTMRRQITNLAGSRFAVFAALLCFVSTAAIPQAEVHEHANATYGHSHDVHDHVAWDEKSASETVGADDARQMHFHDTGAQSLTMLDTSDIAPVACVQSAAGTPPPTARLPDNPIAQRFRPPPIV